MSWGRSLATFFVFFLLYESLVAQELTSPSPEYTRKQLELAIEYALEDGVISPQEAEEAFGSVDQWLSSRRDVNRITAEELAEYRLLSPFQIYQFIRYRTDHSGYIASLYDLKTIPGWDETIALILIPLLSLEAPPSRPWAEGLEHGQLEMAVLHTRHSDNGEKHYIGPPNSLGIRGQYVVKDRLSVFVGAERDTYEPWRYSERVGFDSYTGHVSVAQLGVFRQLVVGDYRASWGEGLVLNQGFRLRPPYTQASRSGIRPMKSLSEGERSRGIAADLGLGRWQLGLIYSSKMLDGNVNDEGIVTGLSEVGLHRTEGELDRRQTVPLKLWGGLLSWGEDRLGVRLGILRESFAPYRLRHATGASRISELDGLMDQTLYTLSYHWMSRTGAIRLSGEVARSTFGGWAWVHNLRLSGGRLGDWGIAMRHITPTYWAYSGRAYTHSLRPNDEQGISFFAESREVVPHWQLSLGIDGYRRASEINRGVGLALRVTAERKSRSGSYWRGSLSYRRPLDSEPALRISLQRHWVAQEYSLSPYLALSRTSGTWSWAVALRGMTRMNDRLRFWALIGAYRASWQGRIYLPEQRLRYQYGFTMLHGKGVRLSAGGLWQISERASLGLRAVYMPSVHASLGNDSELSLAFYFK